jgi:hypothetical protein
VLEALAALAVAALWKPKLLRVHRQFAVLRGHRAGREIRPTPAAAAAAAAVVMVVVAAAAVVAPSCVCD